MISLGFLDQIAVQGEIDNYYKPELFNPDQQVEETVELVEFHEDDIDEDDKNKTEKVKPELSNEFVI